MRQKIEWNDKRIRRGIMTWLWSCCTL